MASFISYYRLSEINLVVLMDNNCKEAILSENYADLIINSGNAFDEIKKIAGVCSFDLRENANTFIPIVATAYDYKNKALYINASRGFTRNENIAPTLAVPGVDLIGPSRPQGYKVSSGTSLAAAHTAGVAAILLEWGIVRKKLSTNEHRGNKKFTNKGVLAGKTQLFIQIGSGVMGF